MKFPKRRDELILQEAIWIKFLLQGVFVLMGDEKSELEKCGCIEIWFPRSKMFALFSLWDVLSFLQR